jgi:hypothetical protein
MSSQVTSEVLSKVTSEVLENENRVTNNSETSNGIRYYYYPNLNAYFDVKSTQFVYKENGKWVRKETIPPNYRGYSAYNKYKVEIKDYYGDYPEENLARDSKMFPADFRGRAYKLGITKKSVAAQNISKPHLNK